MKTFILVEYESMITSGMSRGQIARQYGTTALAIKKRVERMRKRSGDSKPIPVPCIITPEQQALVQGMFGDEAGDLDIAQSTGIPVRRVSRVRAKLGLYRDAHRRRKDTDAEHIEWLKQFRDGGGRPNRKDAYVPTASSLVNPLW